MCFSDTPALKRLWHSLNLSSTDPELLSSVERRGARVDEIDDLVDGLPVRSCSVTCVGGGAARCARWRGSSHNLTCRRAQFKVNDKGRLVVLEGNLQLLEKGDWQERRLFVFTGASRARAQTPLASSHMLTHAPLPAVARARTCTRPHLADCLIWAKYKKKKKSDWSYCGHIMFGSCILSANAVKGLCCVLRGVRARAFDSCACHTRTLHMLLWVNRYGAHQDRREETRRVCF